MKKLRSPSRLARLYCVACLVGCRATNSPTPTSPWPDASQPSETPTLFAPGLISTGLNERDGSLSREGDCFAFTLQGTNSAVIVLVQRQDGRWSAPELAPFSGQFTDLEPAFDPRGGQLLFASRRPLPGEAEAGDANLWRVSYTRDEHGITWGDPVDLAGLNDEGDEYYPSVSIEGELVFTAVRSGGQGGEDLWLAYPEGDEWFVENAGAGVNSPGPEFNACLRPDGGALVFSSVRRGDLGGGDLYISERQVDGSFGSARALTHLNSPSLDYCPTFSCDGALLWFTSQRSVLIEPEGAALSFQELSAALASAGNGAGDLYWVLASSFDI